jgi:dTDP-4-amino-4,6-dideoxygalactose transaminase
MKNVDSLSDFEERLAKFLGVKHVIVTGSGRAALEILLKSCGMEDTVLLCSCFTCSSVPQTILKAGASPCFVDICDDLSTNQDQIRENLPPHCAGILTNYLYGCPTDSLRELLEFAREKNLVVIEDVAQSFGADIGDQKAGSLGDAAIFSFSKIFFPLYRGGCIASNRSDIAQKALSLRSTLQTDPPTIPFTQITLKKRLIKSLGEISSRIFVPSGSFYQSAQDTPRNYSYYEQTYPFHYWNLTESELVKGLAVLESFADLKKYRSNLVKEILKAIEQQWKESLIPVLPYQERYTYSKIPVLMNPDQTQKIKSFLRSHRVRVSMNYQPLTNNLLFAGKSSSCGPCPKSNYFSQYLIPLPVDAGMAQIFRDGSLVR